MTRPSWLEPHDRFEGVGAHELNPRYQHVDGDPDDDYDLDLEAAGIPAPHTPALMRAQGLLSTVALTPRLDGPDVSHWQVDVAPIDWHQVADAPCFWGATKLTQSVRYLDPTAATSRSGMANVRLAQRGLYHWLSSTTDPEEQAAWWWKCAGGLAGGEFAMLDSEEAGITVEGCLAWFEWTEARTKRPGVNYSGAFVSGGTIWTDPRLRESKYGPRPFILAAYTTEARARALPGVAANPWQAWQFSSNGPVPGVSGRCDMNRVDDRGAFDLAAGISTMPTPTPEPEPPPAPAPSTRGARIMYFNNASPMTTPVGAPDGPVQTVDAGKVKWLAIHDGEEMTKQRLWNDDAYIPGCPEGAKTPDQLERIPDFTGMKVPAAKIEFPAYVPKV